MKSIDTLVEDIYAVVNGAGGWDEAVDKYYTDRVKETMHTRLVAERQPGNTLRMSNVGKPCGRQLWYSVNDKATPEDIPAKAKLKFLYGDMLEDLLLALAKAAGHTVTGEQDQVEVMGIKGHRDAVIDGMLIDVKSASTYAFKKKFKANALKEEGNDDFGYIDQLSGYLAAAQDDDLVVNKRTAAFLVIDKTTGELCLDKYDLTKELLSIRMKIGVRKTMVNNSTPPARGFHPIADGKSGNMILPVQCGYCGYKHTCHSGIRTFVDYQGKPKYYTTIKREPKTKEIK